MVFLIQSNERTENWQSNRRDTYMGRAILLNEGSFFANSTGPKIEATLFYSIKRWDESVFLKLMEMPELLERSIVVS
jgi:hypothetical protein